MRMRWKKGVMGDGSAVTIDEMEITPESDAVLPHR